MRASGEAVGVSVLVCLTAPQKIDVGGNLVPVDQISKIIGGVPL